MEVALLQQKAQFIRRYLIKLGASPQDAEDIAQESIYKLFLYIDSIDEEKVSSWLFRVARNHYYDLCRKHNKEIIITTDRLTLVDDEPLPEDHYYSYEKRKQINDVLNMLKPIYKNLLLLKYELELSYEEICELLDMKPGTLKTYLFRARENFKLLYEREVIVNEEKTDREKTDIHETENLFDEESLGESNLKSTIKKAQRKSLFRTVVISTLVTLFIIVGCFIAYPFLMKYQEQKAVNKSEIVDVDKYRSPNIHLTGPQISYNGLFNGTVTFEQYKIIDGKPIDWGEKSVNYSLFGNGHEPYGDYSPIQLEQVKDSRSYDKETKQLIMEFYKPGVKYQKMINDFSRIESMGENYAAEVTLSFHKPLSPQEVREILPENVSLEWYWIYVSDQIDDYPISSDAPYIVGFEHRNDVKSETLFTNWINAFVKNENLQPHSIIKEAYDSLKNEKGIVKEDEIQVMGVVVTGKPQDLVKTKEVSEVRTGVLGAVTDSY